MADILELFNRANEVPIASPWGSDSGGSNDPASLLSGALAHGPTASFRCLGIHTGSSANYAECKYAAIGRNDAGPAIHCSGAGAWYYASLFLSGGVYKAYIGMRNAGAWTDVFFPNVDSGIVPAIGEYTRLFRAGTDLVFDYSTDGNSWSNVATVTHGTLSGGNDGAFFGSSGGVADATTFDEWANYNYAASAGDTIARLIGGDLLQSNLFGRLVA